MESFLDEKVKKKRTDEVDNDILLNRTDMSQIKLDCSLQLY